MLGARRWTERTTGRRGRQHAVRWRQTLPGPAAKTVETRTAFAGEALREGKTCDAPKRLKKRVLMKLAWRIAEGFSAHLTLKLSGARSCASDLNAKLDLGNETEECHGLTTSATRERAVHQQNGNNTTTNKQTAGKRSPGKRQNKHCKTPGKVILLRHISHC